MTREPLGVTRTAIVYRRAAPAPLFAGQYAVWQTSLVDPDVTGYARLCGMVVHAVSVVPV